MAMKSSPVCALEPEPRRVEERDVVTVPIVPDVPVAHNVLEAGVCRDKRLNNKTKEVINQSNKISKWCNKSKARNNLEQFFGVQRVKQSQNNVRHNLLARNLF